MIGKLADRFGTIRVMIPCLFCFAAAFFLISFSRTLPMFLLSGFIAQNAGYVSMWQIMIIPAFIAVVFCIVFHKRID
jgi:MFS family permease